MFDTTLEAQILGFFNLQADSQLKTELSNLCKQIGRGGSCSELSQSDPAQSGLDWGALESEYRPTNIDPQAIELPIQTPLVVDEGRLYFQRYWMHEYQLSQRLVQMARSTYELELPALEPYFDDEHQQQAAALALSQQLAVITGGPGTGKTTTVLKILGLMLQQNPQLNIVLAAPTGKAAQRLKESVSQGKQSPAVAELFDSETLANLPLGTTTLHRLLGYIPHSTEFRHNADNPLVADVVIVDEASMVDLGLMNRLVQALRDDARLILLGDAEQLASVEVGSVLTDIKAGLAHNCAQLQRTYRFKEGIKCLANAVNQRDTQGVLALLNDSQHQTDAEVCRSNARSVTSQAKMEYERLFAPFLNDRLNVDPAEVFAAFSQYQVLCATRADKERFDNLLRPDDEEFYHCRPIMLLENRPDLGLYNGDIGICLERAEHAGEAHAYFETTNEQGETEFKRIARLALPKHESAYAITIHKSQGSEYQKVLVVLPQSKQLESNRALEELLTKELLYTAITRAKAQVELWYEEAVLSELLQRVVSRTTGLAQMVARAVSD